MYLKRIQESDKSIEIFMSINVQDTPGVEFGIAAFMDSVVNGEINGKTVKIYLREREEDGASIGAGLSPKPALAKCEVMSGVALSYMPSPGGLTVGFTTEQRQRWWKYRCSIHFQAVGYERYPVH